jgi:hypothetical protein
MSAADPRRLDGYGLVELPLETCLERLAATDEVEVMDAAADAGHALTFLRELTHPVTRYVLFAVEGGWTGAVSNHRDGSDLHDHPYGLARLFQATTCRVVDAEARFAERDGFRVRLNYEARMFQLADSQGHTLRSITCAHDGDRWVFETSGTAFPVERGFDYGARRKRDRFTSADLHALLRAMGVAHPVGDAFASADRFVLVRLVGDDQRVTTYSPQEADDPGLGYLERGLAFTGILRMDAETVALDLTKAILLSPELEPRAKRWLTVARFRLGPRRFAAIETAARTQLRAGAGET